MSAADNKAVFLSYASQDAEAARRICETLRASGVEVWFDADGGLEHGDEWDAKIRRQIKECVLFMPIVSANTQAREEGYFRIEWDLAAERARGIASGIAFILPVVIDDTREPDALVPDRFRAVQWTRLRGGEVPPEVKQRFLKLWSHRTGALKHATRQEGALPASAAAIPPRRGRLVWIAGVTLVAVIGVVLVQKFLRRDKSAPLPPPAAAVSVSEARKLASRARTLIEYVDNATREELLLADQLCEQALKLDSADAEIWAAASEVSASFIPNAFDRSPARHAKALQQAQRAVALAPDLPYAQFALANYYRLQPATRAQALQMLTALVEREPTNKLYLRRLGNAHRDNTHSDRADFEQALHAYDRAAALPGGDPTAIFNRAQILLLLNRGAEAEAAVDRSLALKPLNNAKLYKLMMLLQRNDLAAARHLLETVEGSWLLEDRWAYYACLVWIWSRETERALGVLRALPRDWLENVFTGPKAFLAALAHRGAQRETVARAEFEAALQIVEKRLGAQPTDGELLVWKTHLLAQLGRGPEAGALRSTFRQAERPEHDSRSMHERALPAITDALLGDEDRALALIEAELSTLRGFHLSSTVALRMDPIFAPLRGHPRFAALIAAAERRESEWRQARGTPAEKSVAVLAFKNVGGDAANDAIVEGIGLELISVLGRVPGLIVRGNSSLSYFKGSDATAQEKGRKLDVSYLVDGSVQRLGNTVRIAANLTLAATNELVWSSLPLNGDVKNIFAVQEEMAGLIAKHLSLKLGVEAGSPQRAVNPEAYQLYLQGRQAWNRRNEDDYVKAADLFSRAIALDPFFGRAYVGRADAFLFLATRRGQVGTWSQRDSPQLAAVTADVQRALDLEPNLAEGHTSLAYLHQLRGDQESAQREFVRAIELNPNYATAHQWIGLRNWRRGMLPEARESILRAAEADPLSSVIAAACSVVLQEFGDTAAAMAQAERAVALQPDSARALGAKAQALLLCGDREAAAALARSITEPTPTTQGVGRALLVLGRSGFPEDVERMRNVNGPLAHLVRLQGAAALGKWDEFFAGWGPQSVTLDDPWFLYFPGLDPVRDDPRFLAPLQEAGLLEAHARARAWRAAHPPQPPASKK